MYATDAEVTLLTLPEVARLAHVSLSTVERAVRRGDLPSVVVGVRSRRVAPDDAAAWMGLRFGVPTPERRDNR